MSKFHQPAIVGFYGYSQSGKTTLICNIITRFKKKGISIGVVKITDKLISSEPEGKDTHAFRQSGSEITAFSSSAETNFVVNHGLDIQDVLQIFSSISKVDLVIIEGAHSDSIPKIRIGEIPLRPNTLFTFSGNMDEIIEAIEEILEAKGFENENHN